MGTRRVISSRRVHNLIISLRRLLLYFTVAELALLYYYFNFFSVARTSPALLLYCACVLRCTAVVRVLVCSAWRISLRRLTVVIVVDGHDIMLLFIAPHNFYMTTWRRRRYSHVFCVSLKHSTRTLHRRSFCFFFFFILSPII